METIELLGSVLGLGFVAGIRLYGTILVLGIGINTGWLVLDPHLAQLEVLANPLVLLTAGIMYVMEFFADKIPWVDSTWDIFHTLIRPLGAVVIASSALGSVDPAFNLAAVLLCGTAALTAHTLKTGTRLVVNHSPEPFSNIGLSLFEDVFSVGAVWVCVMHPLVALAFVVFAFIGLVWIAPKFVRFALRTLRAIVAWIRRIVSGKDGPPRTIPSTDPT